MKKVFARIISFIFVASFALLSVGCFGNDSNYHDELIDKYNRGEITYEQLQEQLKNNMPVPLHGVKVLYRPENYDYDGEGTVGTGNQEYYGQFAWQILNGLTRTYGTTSTDEYIEGKPQLIEGTEDQYTPPSANYTYYTTTGKKYFYDSVRYNLYQQDEYIVKYIEDINGDVTTPEISDKKFKETSFRPYVNMMVDLSKSWNWTFGSLKEPESFIYNTSFSANNKSAIISPTNPNIVYNSYYFTNENKSNNYFDNVGDNYYNLGDPNIAEKYQEAFLGTTQQQAEKDETTGFYTKGYSDYVKALEYVIYCITLEMNPGQVQVTLLTDGTPDVKIKQGNDAPISVDEALAYIKNIFNKIGTYVGFSEAKQAKLVKYILDNVIGSDAIGADSVKQNEYAIYEYKNDAGETVQDIVKINEKAPVEVRRDYTNVVSNIVKAVTEYVHIGNEEGGSPSISDRFPASAIKDYYGTNFMVASDDPFKNIEAMEYQSVVLMFREAFTVDNISLHFKYDAGNDGDSKVTNSAIDIKVYINVYNKGGERKTVATNTIRVKDGPHDYGMEGSTMMLFGIDQQYKKGYTINPFNTELAGGLLHHPDMKFDGTVSRSKPYPLTGTSIAKNYYELVEASDEAANNYYSYGRLNPKAFTPEEDCDYLEINFEVLKVIGDYTTNYKFYTGLGVVQ